MGGGGENTFISIPYKDLTKWHSIQLSQFRTTLDFDVSYAADLRALQGVKKGKRREGGTKDGKGGNVNVGNDKGKEDTDSII